METSTKGTSFGPIARWVMAVGIATLSLAAQTSRGTLTGIVTDAQGAAMAGAQVSLTNENTNVRRQTTANEAGLYRFDAVDPGPYQISVQATGFRTYSKRQVPIGAAQTVSNDVQLEVGETQQTVEVVAQTESALQYEAPVRGGNMGSREVVNLPLPNRRPTQLAFTIPGVVSNRFSSNGSLTGFSVNGARQRSNNFMIDGTENNDISVSGEGLTISNPDVVAEVSIQTTNYDAEFGRAGGGVVNVITKSGTNRFNGTLNYVLDSTYDDALTNQQSQDPALQARGRPGFGIEQFWGGTFGGPIKKDRTFFFGAFQEDRLRSNSTRILNTLSARGRATLNTIFPKGTNPNVDLYNALTAGADATSQFTTQALGNGRPDIEVGTAVQGLSTSTLDRQYLGRVDHRLTDSDQLSGRFIYQTINTPKGALLNVFPGFEADAITKNVSASLTETHIFSPTLTNELRLNYMRLNPLFPVSNPDNELVKTAPQINIAGLTQIGLDNRFPQGRYGNNYQIQDTATYVRGKHSIRFGGDILHQRSKQYAPIAERGALDVRAGGGFTGFANWVDGFTGSGGAINRTFGSAAYYPNMNRVAFFVSDRWRITSDLTLSLGGRYEYFGQPMNSVSKSSWSGLFNIDPVTFTGPFSQPSKVKKDTNNWSPSLGIAWSPSMTDGLLGRLMGNKKTVIRTGYQIGYDSFFNNIASNAQASTPNVIATNISSVVSAALPRGVANPLQSIPQVARAANPIDQQQLMAGDLVNPYIQRWSFGIQRELPGNIIYDISYVGSKATKLFINEDVNPLVPENLRITPPTSTPIPAAQLSGRLDNLQGPRTMRTNGGSSSFHSMQMSAMRRFSNGFQASAAYTWGKTIDNGSEIFNQAGANVISTQVVPPMFGGLQLDKGLSLFHRAHRLVFSYIYELPMYRSQQGVAGKVLGGWQLSGLTTFETGVPANVTNGVDADGIGGGTIDRPIVNPAGRPRTRAVPNAASPTGYVNPDGAQGALTPINPSEARYIGVNANTGLASILGNIAGRNTEFVPGQKNWNVALTKIIRLGEFRSFEIRGDAFNVFNTPQYGTPSISNFSPAQAGISANVFTSLPGRFLAPQFGDGGGRVLRYELRLRF